MSFGFGVGDIIGSGQLAFKLWKHCYKVARDAPEEFKLLVSDIGTLANSIKLLEEEMKDPNSTLMRGGADRIRMMGELMIRVDETLKELQKIADKYQQLANISRGKMRQAWTKFKWSIDASDLDALRNKLVYHNGIITLLLVSSGNSSLQRIEATNMRLERRCSEIGDLLQNLVTPANQGGGSGSGNATGTSSGHPTLTVVDAKTSKILILQMNAALMKNAEVGQRKWSSIGVDEWIQAGRWWLMKAQMALAEKEGIAISQQGYVDLIKASWILIDVIARHPQLNMLDSVVRCEVELLAETIRTELGDIDSAGQQKPDMRDLFTYDLQIWETQVKGPALQPSVQSSSNNRLWMSTDEHVLFQRFGQYQSSRNAIPTPCIVLLMVHKATRVARIVLGNQSWITVEEYLAGKITPIAKIKTVHIDNQNIELATSLGGVVPCPGLLHWTGRLKECVDACLMCVVWGAVREYVLHLDTDRFEQDVFEGFVLLVAVKENHRAVVKRLLKESEDPGTVAGGSFAVRLKLVARTLASELLEKQDTAPPTIRSYVPLFVWAGRIQSHALVSVLLAGIGIIVTDETVQQWFTWEGVSATRNTRAMWLFLSQTKQDLDKRGSNTGLTILQLVAGRGEEAMVAKLITAGADIDAAPGGDRGRTALQAAAEGGHESVVEILLKAGAEINAEGAEIDGRTALQAAAEGGHHSIVSRLLTAGAYINAAGSGIHGRTALQAAAGGGHKAVVKTLLAARANIHAPPGGHDGRTALQAAAEGGYGAVVKKLLTAGAKSNASGSEIKGRTALQAAAGGGHEAVVTMLLAAGANINASPGRYNGRTALQAAAGGGHEQVANILLAAGAKVNAARSAHTGRTALQAAAEAGHRSLVDTLLLAGADVNALGSDYYGRTALQAAAEGGHREVVLTLIAAGADVNAAPGHGCGRTALQAAASGGHHAVVNTLIEAGADINATAGAWQGRTALQAAAGGGHEAVVNALIAAGAEVNAVVGKEQGRTALQAAAEAGHEGVVLTLLKAGADVNAPAGFNNGKTAMQGAVAGGFEHLVGILADYGGVYHDDGTRCDSC